MSQYILFSSTALFVTNHSYSELSFRSQNSSNFASIAMPFTSNIYDISQGKAQVDHPTMFDVIYVDQVKCKALVCICIDKRYCAPDFFSFFKYSLVCFRLMFEFAVLRIHIFRASYCFALIDTYLLVFLSYGTFSFAIIIFLCFFLFLCVFY